MSTKTTMFLGSMDHSPSEQLGKPDDWHTTVLILSEGGEHFDAARDVALRLDLRDGQLRKWAKNPRYRKNREFGAALLDVLPGRAMFIRAISAQARTIIQSYPHMIEELGLSGLVEGFSKNEKPYLKFGPFTRVNYGTSPQTVYFDILERQALPLVFICHFILRVHQQMMPVMKKQRLEIEWVDWQLMHNKFPGDVAGPMGSLFNAIMSGAARHGLAAGNMRSMTINDPREDPGSSFADNIAGWLSEKLVQEGRRQPPPEIGDSFSWEIWQPA